MDIGASFGLYCQVVTVRSVGPDALHALDRSHANFSISPLSVADPFTVHLPNPQQQGSSG